ncbi:MAG: F0F1 ATP synthase subunit B [Acidimicrobiia bacterium]|nr:MAG: F0F1 ATP synthase subunit B [Acidimicrobiia bacterium]
MYLALTVIVAQEVTPISEEGSGGAGLLLPAPEELIAGLLAFGIIFAVVWKFALPALQATIEKRQAAVRTHLEAAEKAKLEAESLLADYRAQVAGAKGEAAEIVAEARDAGEAVKADIIARAESEADQIKARAGEEIVSERERVAEDLRRQVAELSIDVAERVVGSSLDVGAQRDLVDRYIDELGGVR